MGLFARAKEPFLRSFLKLFNGLPSHDVTPAKLRAWPHYFLAPARGSQIQAMCEPTGRPRWPVAFAAERAGGQAVGQDDASPTAAPIAIKPPGRGREALFIRCGMVGTDQPGGLPSDNACSASWQAAFKRGMSRSISSQMRLRSIVWRA